VGAEWGEAVEVEELVQKVAGWEVKQDEPGDGRETVYLLAHLELGVLVLLLDQVLGQC
jgi:hypothetical protein